MPFMLERGKQLLCTNVDSYRIQVRDPHQRYQDSSIQRERHEITTEEKKNFEF